MVTLSPTGASVPTTLNRFFEKLSNQQTPALIWYSANGERIELSGRVLMNWIDKSANLLVEECELEPGEGFDLQAPLHWRTIVLGLAALRVGALLNQDEPLVAAVCTEQEAGYTNDPAYLLAVDRAPLALSYTGDVQALSSYADEVLDYCALVRSFGDQYSGMLPDDSAEVLEGFTYAEAYEQALAQAQVYRTAGYALPSGQRALALELSPDYAFDASEATMSALLEVLAILLSGHAVFVADPSVDWQDEQLASLMDSERIAEIPRS